MSGSVQARRPGNGLVRHSGGGVRQPSAPLRIAQYNSHAKRANPILLVCAISVGYNVSQRSAISGSDEHCSIQQQNKGSDITRDMHCGSAIASILLFDLPVQPIQVDLLCIKLS